MKYCIIRLANMVAFDVERTRIFKDKKSMDDFLDLLSKTEDSIIVEKGNAYFSENGILVLKPQK